MWWLRLRSHSPTSASPYHELLVEESPFSDELFSRKISEEGALWRPYPLSPVYGRWCMQRSMQCAYCASFLFSDAGENTRPSTAITALRLAFSVAWV